MRKLVIVLIACVLAGPAWAYELGPSEMVRQGIPVQHAAVPDADQLGFEPPPGVTGLPSYTPSYKGAVAPKQTGTELYVPLTDEQQELPTMPTTAKVITDQVPVQ